MGTRIHRLGALAAFALALTSLPTTGLAYPIASPVRTSPSATTDSNPLRVLLTLVSQEDVDLWAALNAVYSDSYVATACDQPC
jgi:hypothetical protein